MGVDGHFTVLNSVPVSGNQGSKIHGSGETCRVCQAMSGDIVGCSMVNRGADNGQAQGDVDPVLEMKKFERDKTLIMVHADDGVIYSCRGLKKNGIRRERTLNLNVERLHFLDGRQNNILFFMAKKTSLTDVSWRRPFPMDS